MVKSSEDDEEALRNGEGDDDCDGSDDGSEASSKCSPPRPADLAFFTCIALFVIGANIVLGRLAFLAFSQAWMGGHSGTLSAFYWLLGATFCALGFACLCLGCLTEDLDPSESGAWLFGEGGIPFCCTLNCCMVASLLYLTAMILIAFTANEAAETEAQWGWLSIAALAGLLLHTCASVVTCLLFAACAVS
eukprot:TRINITY_DN65068_c0_g1_i1.p1 TRINITY_DN65068_c0_g1~~TRINITY_DN65068_c0_g1_i1.p1  ORF type:complete len:191 (-),score=30.76 TRINITY_DN65068_c0_g1_i1:749-1321(-)